MAMYNTVNECASSALAVTALLRHTLTLCCSNVVQENACQIPNLDQMLTIDIQECVPSIT